MTSSWTLSSDFTASFFLCIVYLLLQISGANTVFDFLQTFSYQFYLICSHNFSWSFVPMCLAKVCFFTLFSFTQPKCQMSSVTFSFECVILNTNLTGFLSAFLLYKSFQWKEPHQPMGEADFVLRLSYKENGKPHAWEVWQSSKSAMSATFALLWFGLDSVFKSIWQYPWRLLQYC